MQSSFSFVFCLFLTLTLAAVRSTDSNGMEEAQCLIAHAISTQETQEAISSFKMTKNLGELAGRIQEEMLKIAPSECGLESIPSFTRYESSGFEESNDVCVSEAVSVFRIIKDIVELLMNGEDDLSEYSLDVMVLYEAAASLKSSCPDFFDKAQEEPASPSYKGRLLESNKWTGLEKTIDCLEVFSTTYNLVQFILGLAWEHDNDYPDYIVLTLATIQSIRTDLEQC